MVGWRRNARTGSTGVRHASPTMRGPVREVRQRLRSKADKPAPRYAMTTDNPAAVFFSANIIAAPVRSAATFNPAPALRRRRCKTGPSQARKDAVPWAAAAGAARRGAGARPARLLHAENRGRLGVLELLAALAAADEDLGAHILTPFETLVSFAPWEQGRASAADLGSDTVRVAWRGRAAKSRVGGSAHPTHGLRPWPAKMAVLGLKS